MFRKITNIILLLVLLSYNGSCFRIVFPKSVKSIDHHRNNIGADANKYNHAFRSSNHLSLHVQSGKTDIQSSNLEENPLKFAYIAVWVALVGYVFGNIAPPDVDPDYSMAITQKILTSPYDGTVNPIFVAVFNLLGVYPALFAGFLLPGAKKQSIPAWPFVFGAFALGFFAEGPYLAFRKLSTTGSTDEVARGSRLFDNKICPLLLFGFSAFLIYFAIFGDFVGGDKIEDFIRLFTTQRIVHVSTVDFTILTFVIWDAMKEDMIRRRWEGPSAIAFSLIPVFGPIAYAFLRPRLPKSK